MSEIPQTGKLGAQRAPYGSYDCGLRNQKHCYRMNIISWFLGDLYGWNRSLNDKAGPAVLCQEIYQVWWRFLTLSPKSEYELNLIYVYTQNKSHFIVKRPKKKMHLQWTYCCSYSGKPVVSNDLSNRLLNMNIKGRCQHQRLWRGSKARTSTTFSLLVWELQHFWHHQKFDCWCISSYCCWYLSLLKFIMSVCLSVIVSKFQMWYLGDIVNWQQFSFPTTKVRCARIC